MGSFVSIVKDFFGELKKEDGLIGLGVLFIMSFLFKKDLNQYMSTLENFIRENPALISNLAYYSSLFLIVMVCLYILLAKVHRQRGGIWLKVEK